jgi:hypothetical protein
MFKHSQEVLEQARRTRQRSEQLCRELRETVARSLVTLWHSRRQREATAPTTSAPPANELAGRAERAKRNRETVVHTPTKTSTQ